MRRTIDNRLLALFAALILSASAGRAGAQAQYRDVVDTTVSLERGGTLTVTVYGGRVSVVGASGSQVRIRGRMDRDEMTIKARQHSVSISMDSESHRGSGADLDISVPLGTRVVLEGFSSSLSVRGVKGEADLETMSGSVLVSDATGRVSAETVSGRVQATGIDGNLSAESVSGDLTIDNIEGDIESETVSGSIQITRARSKVVRAESVQGSITYDGTIDPSGNYSLATHSGRLTLAVPATAGATVSLETFSGSVDSDFPVTLESGSSKGRGHESEFEFRIGDGRSRIVLETFSGDIKIQRGTGRVTPERE